MAILEHKDIIGADAVHPAAYIQSSDPGAVGAGKAWIDTTGGAGAYVYKIRNAGDTDWDVHGLAVAPASANGQQMAIKSLTELTTVAASATTDTVIQMPAGATILGVSARVTVAITCTTNFDLGDSGSATRFGTGISKAANTTSKGNVVPYVNASALSVRITPDTTPSDATGRVRITIYYLESTPPTS